MEKNVLAAHFPTLKPAKEKISGSVKWVCICKSENVLHEEIKNIFNFKFNRDYDNH